MAVNNMNKIPSEQLYMAIKVRTNLGVSYKWNGKDEPERLNRVYDMIFNKVIKKLNENEHGQHNLKEKI